jgi:glycine/D-amino acid oxidase-like deaminating enzyme
MARVIVVGAGLFGSVAALYAHRKGADVLVIDRGEELAGSGPAACLMKPGWLSKMGANARTGLDLLDELYGLTTIKFRMGPVLTDVHWVDPDRILLRRRSLPDGIELRSDNVTEVGDGYVVLNDRELVTADAVLVAAGVWTNQLLRDKVPRIAAMAGAVSYFAGQVLEPFIKPWAPYKQLVGFNIKRDVTWVGDSSAILHQNWTPDRERQTLERELGAVPHLEHRLIATRTGLRPYVKGRIGLFEQVSKRLFVSSGGAKNGTVLAAYQAKQFIDAIMPGA